MDHNINLKPGTRCGEWWDQWRFSESARASASRSFPPRAIAGVWAVTADCPLSMEMHFAAAAIAFRGWRLGHWLRWPGMDRQRPVRAGWIEYKSGCKLALSARFAPCCWLYVIAWGCHLQRRFTYSGEGKEGKRDASLSWGGGGFFSQWIYISLCAKRVSRIDFFLDYSRC